MEYMVSIFPVFNVLLELHALVSAATCVWTKPINFGVQLVHTLSTMLGDSKTVNIVVSIYFQNEPSIWHMFTQLINFDSCLRNKLFHCLGRRTKKAILNHFALVLEDNFYKEKDFMLHESYFEQFTIFPGHLPPSPPRHSWHKLCIWSEQGQLQDKRRQRQGWERESHCTPSILVSKLHFSQSH